MKTPSKKIFLILLASIFAVGSIFYAVKLKNPKTENVLTDGLSTKTSNKNSGNTTTASTSEDWKRILADINQKALVSTSTKKLTNTDLLAREFLTQYMSAKKAGVTMDSATSEEFAVKLLESNNFHPNPKIATVGSLNLSADNTEASLRQYGNNLGRIINSYPALYDESELAIFSKILSTEKPDDVKKLSTIALNYEKIRADYLKMIVPSTATDSHLALVNSLAEISTDIKGMSEILNDPAVAVASFLNYETSVSHLSSAFEKIIFYFLQNNISFQQGDDGYSFVHSI